MNLVTALLQHGQIRTTLAKARFIRPQVERVITLAKRGLAKAEAKNDESVAVHARRLVASRLNNDRVLVQKVFDELAPRYMEREGGYTRIMKLGPRKGDNAPMAMIALVDHDED